MSDITFGAFYGGFRYGEGIASFAREVEGLGFDGFWCGEHLLLRGPTVDALTAMAVAAGATSKITIGSSILLLPLHHPTMVAKAVTTLDYASQGRVVLGTGIGGQFPKEFEAVGVPMAERGRKTDEALEIIKRLWTEETVTYAGRFYSLDGVSLEPKPLQRPHPPIWLAGRREAAMRRAAKYGDGWMPYLYTPEAYKQSLQRIQTLAQGYGRGSQQIQPALLVYVAISDTAEEAQRGADVYHGAQMGVNLEGFSERYDLLGPSRECIRRLEEYVDAGVRHFIFNWACAPKDIPRNLETVATEVIPHFR